jgi:hypothetical protein
MNSTGRTNKNSGIGPLQTALLARSKNKLQTNESELTELRKLVDAGKGGVPMSQLLSSLGCQADAISGLGGTDNNVLQKLKEAIPKKEDECHKARELVAEANSNQQGSAPRNPAVASSVLPTQSSKRRSSLRKLVDAGEEGVPVSQLMSNLGCQTDKIPGLGGTDNNVLQKLEAAILKKEDECHKARELVAESEKISRTEAPIDESLQSPRRRSSLSSRRRSSLSSRRSSLSSRRRSSLSSRNEKTKETQAPEIRDGDSEEGRRVPKYSITSDGILIDESSHSSSEKKSETRPPEIRGGASKEARQPSHRRSKSEKISWTQKERRHSRKSSNTTSDFLMDDCHEARKLIAEANRNQQGSAHQDYPVFLSPVLPTKSSHSLLRSESSHSSRNLKESVTQALEADMCERARELASIGIVVEF